MYVIVDIPGPMQPEKKVGRKLVNLCYVAGISSDSARRAAFRLVMKRKEKDYQELAENTSIIDGATPDKDLYHFALNLE